MIIYKIENKLNGKKYIGQTTKTLKERFARHLQDATSERLDTHLARAIRKYGKENFAVEEIDHADSQDELNSKETYWIEYYNSVKEGYNMTSGSLGGNTYLFKTDDEMNVIKNKIRETKIGDKNPNATAVKCRNEVTGEEYHFGSVEEMRKFFNHPNHNFITKRCSGEIHCLFDDMWNIAYECNEYAPNMKTRKYSYKSTKIHVKDIESGYENDFPSYTEAEKYFGLRRGALSGKAYLQKEKDFICLNKYKITILD